MIHQVISGKCFNWGFPYKNMERKEEHLGAEAFSRVQTRQKAGAEFSVARCRGCSYSISL